MTAFAGPSKNALLKYSSLPISFLGPFGSMHPRHLHNVNAFSLSLAFLSYEFSVEWLFLYNYRCFGIGKSNQVRNTNQASVVHSKNHGMIE